MTSLRTSTNFDPDDVETEDYFEPSMTQPDETLSIREILEKHTRGLPLDTGDIGYYDDPDDLDLSEFDALDPFEKEMYLREQQEYIETLQKRMQDTGSQNPVNSSDPQGQEPAEGGKPQMSDGETTPQE